MKKVELEASVREGKMAARKLKREGKVPAVVYGKETKSMPIEIKVKDIEKTVKYLAEGTLLITLKLTDKDKKEEKTVVIQEVQRDPRTEEIVHTDFHQLNENEKAVFHVPVFSTGVSEGVKIGGMLEHPIREVIVRCLPANLPEKFMVDITGLKIGQDFTIGELPVPEGVEIMDDGNKVLFAVVAHKVEEEKAPAEGEAAAAASAEPEVITAKKPKEGEEAAGAKKEEKKK
ncbi:MAG TPA: 50S ribosomal protein L25 [bacterium]|nr:50S ribosomal protein L25 [bacterium]